MLLDKDFRKELSQDNEDDFLLFLRDVNYICVDKKLDADIARRAKLFATRAYSFAQNTCGSIYVEYASEEMRLSAAVNYSKMVCVDFISDDLKSFAELLEVSTRVIIGPPEAENEDVMIIFEHDMR